MGFLMGHIPSYFFFSALKSHSKDPSQRRLHLQGDLLARQRRGRRDFDRRGARRFGAAREEVFGLGDRRWDMGDMNNWQWRFGSWNISEPVFCKFYRNAQIYQNILKQPWIWIRKRWSFPWISPLRLKKIWLLAQALSTWVAPLILGI